MHTAIASHTLEDSRLATLREIATEPATSLGKLIERLFLSSRGDVLFPEIGGHLEPLKELVRPAGISYAKARELLDASLAIEPSSEEFLKASSRAVAALHSSLSLLCLVDFSSESIFSLLASERILLKAVEDKARSLNENLLKIAPDTCAVEAMRMTLVAIKQVNQIHRLSEARIQTLSMIAESQRPPHRSEF